MAKSPKMTAARRNSLPASKMGLPDQGKFPVDTPGRAANAKARATQQVKKGNMSPSAKNKVDAKANQTLRSAKGGSRMTSGQAQKAAGRIRSRISTRKKNKTQVGFD